jgi:ectoine hydroxylase
MKPDQVLQHRPIVLTEAQRAEYFEKGYLVLPDYVPAAWIARLRMAMAETIELSRSVTQSDGVFVLEEGHSAENCACIASPARRTGTRRSGTSWPTR